MADAWQTQNAAQRSKPNWESRKYSTQPPTAIHSTEPILVGLKLTTQVSSSTTMQAQHSGKTHRPPLPSTSRPLPDAEEAVSFSNLTLNPLLYSPNPAARPLASFGSPHHNSGRTEDFHRPLPQCSPPTPTFRRDLATVNTTNTNDITKITTGYAIQGQFTPTQVLFSYATPNIGVLCPGCPFLRTAAVKAVRHALCKPGYSREVCCPVAPDDLEPFLA